METSSNSQENTSPYPGRRTELFWFIAIWIFGGSIGVNCYYSPEVNTSIDLAFTYLSIPLSVISFFALRYFTKADKAFQNTSIFSKGFVYVVFAVMFIGIPGNALVLLGNAWFASGYSEPIEGKVMEKWSATKSKGGRSNNVRKYSEKLHRTIWIEVSPSTYSDLTVGQIFRTNKVVGAFDIIYHRR